MATLPSRKITAAFIGVFVIGVVVGWLNATNINNLTDDAKVSQFMNRANDPVSMAARINQKYAADYRLTPEQQARIAPLANEAAQHLYQLRHQFGVDVIAAMDEFHSKVAGQMTDEQRGIYAKANEDRKTRMTRLLLADPPQPAQGQK